MNSIIGAGAVFAGKELFGKAMSDVHEFVKKRTGDKLRQWSTEKQINTLYGQISKVRKVKTIWQVDKAVDLMDFYCDSYVLWYRKRHKITRVSDLPTDDNILIEGIAGQGKSILLRYLCAAELTLGNYIPIFLELRRISREQPLKKRIAATFEALGLDVDDKLFGHLVASGKVLLLLDAFDEIPDDLKAPVLTDIEDLAAKHNRLRIIVTSRPQHNIRASNHFTVVTLDNLIGDEYTQVIRKLAGRQAWAGALIDHIETKARHMRELLCTPLIVTLLVIQYKSWQKLPTRLSEFYDALFQTLLQRHDGSKPGFTRKRECALDDNQYRVAFEALCILAKKQGHQSFDHETMRRLATTALSQCQYSESPVRYIDDIVRITSLILRDGEECRFIHKTVHEYYTASYIQRKPTVWAAEYYAKVLDKGMQNNWEQELGFLSEIDTYRYNKYYLLPAILGLFGITEAELDHDVTNEYCDWLKVGTVSFDAIYENGRVLTINPYTMRNQPFLMRGYFYKVSDVMRHMRNISYDNIRHEINAKYKGQLIKLSSSTGKDAEKWIHCNILLQNELLKKDITDIFNYHCADLIQQARNIRASIREEENPSLLDGLM